MKDLLICVVVVTVIGVVKAHMCLLSPPQRGTLTNLNHAGASDCILLKGPCGGRTVVNRIGVKQGSTMKVLFQKNLGHWITATPGHFEVNILAADETTKLASTRVPDKGEPNLTLYTADLVLPTLTGHATEMNAVVQVVYVTMDPGSPAKFFQCSDIKIN